MGVLVAVSIPIFTSQLEKAREATDLANLRAAKAAAVAAYLGEESPVWSEASGSKSLTTDTLYYNTATGKIDTSGNACGKGTAQSGGCESTKFGSYEYTAITAAAGKKIEVNIDSTTAEVTCKFVD